MLGRGPDEGDAVLLDDLGELGVLRQEAIAGMDRFGAGDLAGGDDGGDVEIGLGGGGRPDADAFIGQAHMHGVGVGGGMDRDGGDAHFLAGAVDAKRDLAAIGDEDFFEHSVDDAEGLAELDRLAVVDADFLTLPPLGAVIGFMVFIASTMNSVSPSFTVWPTLMKAGLPGSGDR